MYMYMCTSSVAWERSALSKIQWERSLPERLQRWRLAHLKLICFRSKLDRSTPWRLIP